MDKKDGGPAFPETHVHPMQGVDDLMPGWRGRGGMSLRDYFAATAMAQVFIKPLMRVGDQEVELDWGNIDIGGERIKEIVDYTASLSYLIADAMLVEREK